MWINNLHPYTEPVCIGPLEITSAGERALFIQMPGSDFYFYVCVGHAAIETFYLEPEELEPYNQLF